MEHDDILREISSLPPEGQRQVIDFIASMNQRYRQSQSNEQPVSNFSAESFVGIWKDRKDLIDSVDWIRHVRESEWKK